MALLGALSLATWGAVVASAPPVEAGIQTLIPKATFTEDGTFTVPDGVQCVQFRAVGAAGGFGEDPVEGDGFGGDGGNGGEVFGTLLVTPHTVFDVGVGLRGADGPDDGGGGAATGGDGGEGDLGWGGGGGGASSVSHAGAALLVAGGGGGGGAAQGDVSGGNGGYGGDTPTKGGDAGEAIGGGGATESAPGGAGTNASGGTEPTAGADAGGYGGNGGSDFAGGGGGGGGWFGGGGGGAGNDGGGAGGGGGSNHLGDAVEFGSSSNNVSTTTGDGVVEVFYTVGDTSCLSAPLTVKKVVSGVAVAPGTTFTEHVACDAPISVPVGSDLSTSSRDFTFTVDASGVAQPAAGYTIGFGDQGPCTVTETATGGATSVAYACESALITEPTAAALGGGPSSQAIVDNTPVCPVPGPTDAPITVNVVRSNQTATVTVTNTFAAAIQPTFTG